MDSLSRPTPQRRKHSTATDAFPLKSPYDDVFVARAGRVSPLQAHEYTEIFAGTSSSPSSIPVLDLSGLHERAGSDDFRVSVQDYSSIFGDLRNDDVAVPYQELLGGFAKRAKPPRKSADIKSPLQYSSPLHPSENTKNNGKSVDIQSPLQHSESLRPSESAKRPTSEASNQSVEGGKQQINVSFSRTSQMNSDVLNGKMHVAELHSVPGFTYFVDGTPQQQKAEDRKPIPHSLKREVSRTWSFSADVEDAKGKRGLSSNRPHIPEVPHNRSEGNLKLHSSKKPPSSSCPEKPSDAKQNRASDFASKEDSSKKSAVGYSPPFLDEEFDENSVAAASAAALKKAIDQAQESIRIAKLIMERKKEGHRDRYKTRSSDGGGDLDAETKIRHDAYASNENHSAEEYEEADSTFWVDDKCIPSGNVGSAREKVKVAEGRQEEFARGAKFFTFGCSKNVEICVGEKFELEKYGVAKEQGEEVARGSKLFTSDGSQSEGICHGEKAQLGKNVENAELAKECGEEFATGGGPFSSLFRKGENIYVGEKVQLEMNGENVEAAKGHGEDLGRGDKLVVSDCKSEGVGICEKVQLDNVESNEIDRETADFTGFATLAERKTANLGSGEVVNNDSLMLSMNLPLSNLVTVDTLSEILGRGDVAVSDTEPKVLVELAEKPSASHRMQDPVDNFEETEQSETTFYHVKASQDIFEPVEKILDTLQSTRQGKAVDEDAENKISLEDEVARISKNNMDEHGSKSEECDEMHNGEHWTALESGFINFSSGTDHIIGRELLEHEVTEKEAENVPRGEETEHGNERTYNEEENGLRQEEVHLLFESKEPPKEVLEEEIGKKEASISPKIEEADKKIETCEPEIDTDRSPAHESDEPKLPRELYQDSIEERPNGTPEHEAAESLMVEENSFAEIQKNEAFRDMEEMYSTFGGTGRSVEDGNICDFQKVVYDDDVNEAVDSNILGASPVFSEPQETCVIDSNSETSHYQKTVNSNVENDTVPDVTEAKIEEDAEGEPLFHQVTDELPAGDNLHWNPSEETVLEGKQRNVFEGPSDGKADIITDSKENLSENEHPFKPADENYGADYAANDDGEMLPRVVPSDGGKQEFNLTDVKPVQEQTSESDQGSESTFSLDNIDQFSAHESEGDAENVKDETSSKEEMVDESGVSDEKNYTEEQEGLCSQPQSEPEEDKFVGAKITGEKSSNIEKEDLVDNFLMGDKDAKRDADNIERQQRIEAIKRAREQEKDRLVVERAIREARERAFAEARERAARAAAEKAASEARQSRMKEAQKKFDKAPAVMHSSDKASTEAKLKAERAAVERATVEARERALEKALSQKIPMEPRADRNAGLKHSFSSSDLEDSTYTESARRRQARLERHQRTMERAAKALAEKNMRDILAQKEQAERNRLAESLDAEIKRWASGKEGNLRALLSTLQYILGRDSGWKPISLTEIVTTPAVKKAYRKATLYVHPDKLQQRGASIQQKYICEKVFDLLKAAWNKFNSEER